MKDADIIVQSHDRRSILTFLIVVYSFHGQVSDQHFDLIKVSKLKNAKPKRRRTPKKGKGKSQGKSQGREPGSGRGR